MTEEKMSNKKISRRDFLKASALAAGGAILTGCATPTAQVIKETVSVKETVVVQAKETVVVPEKETIVVTATAAPPTPVPPPQPAKLVAMVGGDVLGEDQIKAFLKDSKLVTEIERLDVDATRLRAMFAAGTPPDVWQASGADVPVYTTHDMILDLTDFFNTGKLLKPEDIADQATMYFKYQGGWYGMNTDFSCDMPVIISKSAFQDAGLDVPEPKKIYTYKDAAVWAQKLTKRQGARTVRIGWGDNEWWDAIIQTVLLEEGNDVFVNSFSKATIKDNQTVVDLLTYYANLAKENVIWNTLNPSPSWAGEDITVGRAGFVRYGYWMHGVIVGTQDVKLEDFEMRAPLSWGGKVAVDPPLGGNGWFIAKSTQVPYSAWELYEWFFGGPPAQARATSGWGIPSLKSLWPQMPQATVLDKQFYDHTMWELQNTVQKPRSVNPFMSTSTINDSWARNLESYLRGEIKIEEAIANLDKDVNDTLQKGINAEFK
jgi:multiple sugar transport system substrate-binding protein